MDPEWKKQNPGPDSLNNQPTTPPSSVIRPTNNPDPSQPDSTTSLPQQPQSPETITPGQTQTFPQSEPSAQPPSTTQPSSLQSPIEQGQPVQNYTQPPKRFNTKVIVFIVIILILLIGGVAGAYFLTKKSDKNQDSNSASAEYKQESSVEDLQITVPSNWKTIDTEHGFTIKAPSGWDKASPTDFTFNNIQTSNVLIDNSSKTKTPGNSQGQQNTDVSISAGTEKLMNSDSQEELERLLTDPEAVAEAYADFGLTKDQITINSTRVRINGKEWLRIDSDMAGEIETTFAHWVDDHAIVLIASGKDRQAVDKQVNDYLLSMTASVEIK